MLAHLNRAASVQAPDVFLQACYVFSCEAAGGMGKTEKERKSVLCSTVDAMPAKSLNIV